MDIYIYMYMIIYIYGLYGEKHVENHQPDMVCTGRRRMHMLIILLDVSDEGYGVPQYLPGLTGWDGTRLTSQQTHLWKNVKTDHFSR